jgi:Mlc titration factor MtfA (ptsG expression regulator)
VHLVFGFFKRRRRRRLRATPFPAAWRRIAHDNAPCCRPLAATERTALFGHAQVLLAEKRFEGCGGLELTDEIRVTIAVQAALLLLNRVPRYYPRLSAILVYPTHYVAPVERMIPGGILVEGDEARVGESWHHGNVVLSWQDIRHDALRRRRGHNVILHEFAHQLDGESGAVDGMPALPSRAAREAWARDFQAAFEGLKGALAGGRRGGILRPYAATSPPEFFAVATEAFFEQPVGLRRAHRAVYDHLSQYYAQDPAAQGVGR